MLIKWKGHEGGTRQTSIAIGGGKISSGTYREKRRIVFRATCVPRLPLAIQAMAMHPFPREEIPWNSVRMLRIDKLRVSLLLDGSDEAIVHTFENRDDLDRAMMTMLGKHWDSSRPSE